jgi:hypothetical protein
MVKLRAAMLLSLWLLLVLSGCSEIEPPPGTEFSAWGVVTTEGSGVVLPGVEVTFGPLIGLEDAFTDSSGVYTIFLGALPDGELAFAKAGYDTVRIKIPDGFEVVHSRVRIDVAMRAR